MKSFQRSLQRSVMTKLGKVEEQETDQLQLLFSLMKEHETHMDIILRAGLKFAKSSTQFADDTHSFADTLLTYADTVMGDDSLAGSSLKYISDFFHLSEHRRGDLHRELDAKLFNGVRTFIKDDISSAKEQKKKHSRYRTQFEDCRDELESARLNKKTTNERKKELEDMFEAAKISLHESEYETTSVFLDCTKNNEFVMLENMLETFDLLYAYHCTCQNWLEQKRPIFANFKAKIKEERETYEKNRAVRASRTPVQKSLLIAKNALFGVPLKAVLQRDRDGGSQDCIPVAIRQFITFISTHGMKEEGIFRISGNQNQVKQWRENIDLGDSFQPILIPSADPHLICALLKQFLRELPEPLCTLDLYDPLLAYARIPCDEKTPEPLRDLLLTLPPANYYLFREIIRLSANVTAYKELNKMTPSNMATVMAPNLIHKVVKGVVTDAASVSFEDIKPVSDLFIYMVENFADVFVEEPLFPLAAVRSQSLTALSNLLNEEKIDPNWVDPQTGNSLLNVLLDLPSPSSDVIQFLVDSGADINKEGGDGRPPLFRAVGPSNEKRAALICLINLGADTSKSYLIKEKPTTLMDVVMELDPTFAADIRDACAHLQSKSQQPGAPLTFSLSSPSVNLPSPSSSSSSPSLPPSSSSSSLPPLLSPHSATPPLTSSASMGRLPVGLPPPLRSSTGVGPSPSYAPPLPPLPSTAPPDPIPSRSNASPSLPSTPQPTFGSSSAPRSSIMINASNVLPSSLSLPESSSAEMKSEEERKADTLPVPKDIQPVYRQICLDALLVSLGNFIAISATPGFDPESLDDLNAALVQVAQSLKNMLTSPGADIRSFADNFSDSCKHSIRKSAQNIQDAAKKLIHAVRQVNAERNDSSQKDLVDQMSGVVAAIRAFFITCESAAAEMIVKETQSLSKCLTEFLSAVKVSTDPAAIRSINSTASVFVIHINQLVKVRALEIPDREIQSKLSKCCSSIAVLTSEMSRQSLAVLSTPVEFRNLEPVGSKAKGILAEFQSIYSLIHTGIPELYCVMPNQEIMADLRARCDVAIERACTLLESGGSEEEYVNAKVGLPVIIPQLFSDLSDGRDVMRKTAVAVSHMRKVCEKIMIFSENGNESTKHKVVIFGWALEYHMRLALLAAATLSLEIAQGKASQDSVIESPIVRLPYVIQQACGCFLQLLITHFGKPEPSST